MGVRGTREQDYSSGAQAPSLRRQLDKGWHEQHFFFAPPSHPRLDVGGSHHVGRLTYGSMVREVTHLPVLQYFYLHLCG